MMVDISSQIKKDVRGFGGRFSAWWWIGIPLFVALASYGPLLFLRCGLLPVAGEACWRIFSVGQLVFDVHAYLEFIGGILSHSNGIHIRWIGGLIRGLRVLFPGISVVEMWLVLRVVSGVLSWWMLSWTLSFLTNRPLVQRRFAATVLWIAVFLPLGFRPGVFSWFLPFGLAMLVGCIQAESALRASRVARAIAWSLFAVFCSSIYSWFLVFALIWMGMIWGAWLSVRRGVGALWVLATFLAILGSIALVLFAPERVSVTLQTYMRNSVEFTRMAQLSVMLIAAVCWGILYTFILPFIQQDEDRDAGRYLIYAWIVTIAGWCSNVATSIYIQNDHFRIFTLLLSWASAFVLFTREAVVIRLRWQRVIVYGIGFVSLGMVLRILAGPYILDRDQLNVIHLFVWVSLLLSSYRVLGLPALFVRPFIRRVAIVAIACGIGFVPYVVMFQQEAGRLSILRTYDSMIAWIQREVPARETICADPAISEDVGAFSGHSIFFTLQNTYSSGSDRDIYERLSALASLTNAAVSSTRNAWTEWLTSRGTTCQQFSLYRKTVFSRMDAKTFDRMSGCPRDRMDAETNFVRGLSRAYGIRDDRAMELCPWVVIERSSAEAWNLPEPYQRRYQDGRFEIYEAVLPF